MTLGDEESVESCKNGLIDRFVMKNLPVTVTDEEVDAMLRYFLWYEIWKHFLKRNLKHGNIFSKDIWNMKLETSPKIGLQWCASRALLYIVSRSQGLAYFGLRCPGFPVWKSEGVGFESLKVLRSEGVKVWDKWQSTDNHWMNPGGFCGYQCNRG